MKRRIRFLALALALAALLGGRALADTSVGTPMRVVNCESFVTLRWEPDTKADAVTTIPLGARVTCLRDDGRFVLVSYAGEQGYVLSQYLLAEELPEGAGVALTENAAYNINLFLSNFTESNLAYLTGGAFAADEAADGVLVEFAIDHIWFNQQDKIEEGEYFSGNNTRLADRHIEPVLDKYFALSADDLAPIYMDYADGYYYWCETGGHIPDGFCAMTACYDLGDGLYRVYFETRGAGQVWDNDICAATLDAAREAYPVLDGFGCAVIRAGYLEDRSSFTLRTFALAPV